MLVGPDNDDDDDDYAQPWLLALQDSNSLQMTGAQNHSLDLRSCIIVIVIIIVMPILLLLLLLLIIINIIIDLKATPLTFGPALLLSFPLE